MLTDAKLRKMNGKPIPKRIELSDANGLSVRITPTASLYSSTGIKLTVARGE